MTDDHAAQAPSGTYPAEPGTPIGSHAAGATGADESDARRSIAVFDIDGVLADVRHRLHHVAGRPKDWDAFFGAAPADAALSAGVAAVASAAAAGHVVMYLTGRPERCRVATADWLAAQGLPAGELFMRADTDRRPARVTKVATLRRLSRRYEVVAFVDDDAAVVEAVRGAGFPVLHALWMEPSTSGADSAPDLPSVTSAQDVLFEIQENEGRT
ncbi:MAG: HAD family acid phosphatase [Candidatus Nanopelagicales bacterium]